jgi:hypothetical protein
VYCVCALQAQPKHQLKANRPNDMTCPLCMFVAGKVRSPACTAARLHTSCLCVGAHLSAATATSLVIVYPIRNLPVHVSLLLLFLKPSLSHSHTPQTAIACFLLYIITRVLI